MSSGISNTYTVYHNHRSIRLPGYDYSHPMYYFMTICIHDRARIHSMKWSFLSVISSLSISNSSVRGDSHEPIPPPKSIYPDRIRASCFYHHQRRPEKQHHDDIVDHGHGFFTGFCDNDWAVESFVCGDTKNEGVRHFDSDDRPAGYDRRDRNLLGHRYG